MLDTGYRTHEDHQWTRIAAEVPRWLREVPLYRQPDYEPSRQQAAAESPHGFRTLPFITKNSIRQDFPRNFLPAQVSLDSLVARDLVEIEHTSGSTDEQISLLLERGWWGKQERRALELNPFVAQCLHTSSRRVSIVTPVCSGDICYTATPAHSERQVENALFVNVSRHPFFWTEAHLARMAREIQAWQPVFLDVDPVYGAVFARYCERQQIRFPSLRFIVASYEFVSQNHRHVLERVFQVPVFDLYGSTETGHLLMENQSGEMVPSTKTAFLEVIEADDQGIGELVATTLTHQYMPLLRYRIGDLVRMLPHPQGPRYEVHGRSSDTVKNRQGRRVTVRQVDRCFDGIPGVLHYQLRQLRPDRFQLYWVPDDPGLNDVGLGELRQRLQALLGVDAQVELDSADFIPCESSGKFRLCHSW